MRLALATLLSLWIATPGSANGTQVVSFGESVEEDNALRLQIALSTTPGVPLEPLPSSLGARLRKHVDFWIRIYTQYDTRQGLVHDTKNLDIVYEALDYRGGGNINTAARTAKRRYREILLSLHRKQADPSTFTEDEKRVYQLFRDIEEPDKFLKAAHRKRLRFQLGQRNRFMSGLIQAGKLLPTMEEIFKREGLPIELTRLPFVESSFNVRARSKVGASGIWQFMRSTAKLFIRVDDAVDERNDPIRATEGAARLLRLNYESLRSWPLAVTAYNHGRKGLMRAVRRLGASDFEELLGSYKGRGFGFASSNFYAELLACIEVERNAEKYFGPVNREKAAEFYEVTIPDYVQLKQLVSLLNLDPTKVAEMNPGLTDAVLSGELLVPAGYKLRLPFEENPTSGLSKDALSRVFAGAYAQIPDFYKKRAQFRQKIALKRGKAGRGFRRNPGRTGRSS